MNLPKGLLRSLGARQTVAYVGAGFCVPCGMPAWEQLIGQALEYGSDQVDDPGMRKTIRNARLALRSGELTVAATFVNQLLSTSDLRQVIQDAFDSELLSRCNATARARMQKRMANLAAGPWAGIITTNFDNLIETGLTQSERGTVRCDGTDEHLGGLLARSHGRYSFANSTAPFLAGRAF